MRVFGTHGKRDPVPLADWNARVSDACDSLAAEHVERLLGRGPYQAIRNSRTDLRSIGFSRGFHGAVRDVNLDAHSFLDVDNRFLRRAKRYRPPRWISAVAVQPSRDRRHFFSRAVHHRLAPIEIQVYGRPFFPLEHERGHVVVDAGCVVRRHNAGARGHVIRAILPDGPAPVSVLNELGARRELQAARRGAARDRVSARELGDDGPAPTALSRQPAQNLPARQSRQNLRAERTRQETRARTLKRRAAG
jgi:hypothetical protein